MSKVSGQQEDLLTDYGMATTAYLLMAMSIDSLEHRNKQLEDENAKLREELESVGTAAYLYGRSDLKAENAKLREARGTCHVECYDDGVDEALDGEWCSYAPPTWYLSCEHEACGVDCPSFCPVCGRQIVDKEESE